MMPLLTGNSKKVIEKNFKMEKAKHPDMPNKQRIAIVLSTAKVPVKRKK
jgi:uncharacterized alpha/beta hydrolase family protein